VRVRIVLVLAAVALLFIVPAFLDFLADWLWFGEVGYRQVYSTEITARSVIGIAAFAGTFAWLALNARFAMASMALAPMTFTTREGFTVALPTRDQVRPLVMILIAIAAFLIASLASSEWMTLLLWWHHQRTGTP